MRKIENFAQISDLLNAQLKKRCHHQQLSAR